MWSFNPFPFMETENLILRRLKDADLMDLHEMRRDPRMILYTDSRLDDSLEETKDYLDKMDKGIEDGKWIIWAMEHRETGKVIGSLSIWNLNQEKRYGELGYGIIPAFQNRGFMKEALGSIMEFGFGDMGLEALEAYTEEKNLPSVKLLESLGFQEAGRVEEKGFFSDRIFHMVVFKLERTRTLGFWLLR